MSYSLYSELTAGEIALAFIQASGRADPKPNGCIESTYATDAKNYAQVRFNYKKYYVHVIAAIHRYQRIPGPGEEVSHLCHNRTCFNMDHLAIESGLVNKSRLCCELFKTKEGYKCPHEPTCFGAEVVKPSEE